MPIYDYECVTCGQVHEVITTCDDAEDRTCPLCHLGMAHRIISSSNGSVYLGNQDANWLKSVKEVVGKETAEGRAFHANPTRDNYRNWMRAKGLRPLEPGEKPRRPEPVDTGRITQQLYERYRKRTALNVRG